MNFLQNRNEWVSGFVPEPFRLLATLDGAALPPDVLPLVEAYRQHLTYGGKQALVLYGPPGAGKTRLASVLWNMLAPHVGERRSLDDALRAGTADNVAWVTGADIPALAKGGHHHTLNHVESAYLAVIDDLDKCPTGGWSKALFSVIDHRTCQTRKPSIVTMNATPRKLVALYGAEGGPIWDRIQRSGSLVIRMERQDRQAKASA